MAIVITSLTPTNPTTPAGSSVVFNIGASEDTGLTLSYEWQYSTDGINYSSSGLSNNTSNSYDTGPLTVSQTGIYYRCVVSTTSEVVNSNEVAGIGDRIVSVFQDPSILLNVDSAVDFLPTSQIKSVGDTLVLTVTASLANADITNSTLVSNLSFQWQESNDGGSTWFNLATGQLDITISDTISQITGATTWMKYSTLSIQNLAFVRNQNQYRVIVSYTGAINTPVTSNVSQLLIDPVINVIRQPGVDAGDTKTTNCYKTSISGSGDVRISVSALTTAGTSLDFTWQVNFSGEGGTGEWYDIDQITSFYVFQLKPGTTASTDVLELERFIYYDNPGFRCLIQGSNGEAAVTTTPHYIFMTDVEGTVDLPALTYDIDEDRYGDIVDRDIYVNDPVQDISITAEQDIQRNTGQNGNNTYTWQRQEPGSSTWTDLADPAPVTVTTEDGLVSYTQFPTTLANETVDITVQTPPLRVSVDDGAKYRLKVESSSQFTLVGSTKTITPYYSDEIDINVYPTIYVTNEPGDAEQYPNYSTGFSVTATPSSGLVSDITYQWQYNTSSATTGWVDIANASPYSGATTNLLTINPIPANTTYTYFRCVLSIPGQLSSVTSEIAELTLLRDYFTALSALNDVIVREFDNHTFSVTASSVSAGPISFQWEKSTNFNPATNTGTWTTLTGETNASLNILSIGALDNGFYRVKATSSGGEELYSNAAQLTMQAVNVTIITNIVTSVSVLEGSTAEYTFECEGLSSINTEISYQWEIKRTGDASFSPIGSGANNSVDTERIYVLRALDNQTDNDAKIRCKLTAPDVPGEVYTNECTVTVIRRFSYFADQATKVVTIGDNLSISLNPSFTGGTPSYSWVEDTGSANGPLGETGDVLVIPNIDSSYNGKVYKCLITLDGCTQHVYSRNNVVNTVTVSGPTYTVSVTISTTVAPSVPVFYSNETSKSGAAIGTVICIPKPADYVDDPSASGDDAHRWGCARSGTAYPGTLNTSTIRDVNNKTTYHDGDVWTANKPSWADDTYISPKWLLSKDRFPGFIELRGQTIRAAEFPELARHFGTKFGGTITGSYPNYNSTDTFEVPMTYAKRLMGTGNINNNAGSTSVVPTYAPDGNSGGDKNVPGSMGGVYNYTQSQQLPPGSPGLSGQPDGTADGSVNAATFSIGSYQTTGVEDVTSFAQPSFAGTVNYTVADPGPSFTDLPTHSHTAVAVGWRETQPISNAACFGTYEQLNGGTFNFTTGDGGSLENSTTTIGDIHDHSITDAGPGTFDMVTDAGMNITDTTLRFTGANASIINNNISFFLRNNERVPMNAPYFRLKYMIKAY